MTASPPLGIVSPLAKLLSNRHDHLSLSLSLSLSSSLQGRTNIVSGPPPPPLDSSKNRSRNEEYESLFSSRIFTINRRSNWNWNSRFFFLPLFLLFSSREISLVWGFILFYIGKIVSKNRDRYVINNLGRLFILLLASPAFLPSFLSFIFLFRIEG